MKGDGKMGGQTPPVQGVDGSTYLLLTQMGQFTIKLLTGNIPYSFREGVNGRECSDDN